MGVKILKEISRENSFYYTIVYKKKKKSYTLYPSDYLYIYIFSGVPSFSPRSFYEIILMYVRYLHKFFFYRKFVLLQY